jgi:quinol monooxygenase YgiN
MKTFKIALAAAATLLLAMPAAAAEHFGVIAHLTAQAGKRDAMIDALSGLIGMKGNISFVIAKDGKNADGIYITEIWESKEAHDLALTTDQFKAAFGKAAPMMGGAPDLQADTWPVAGVK